ncbi:ATP-binding protein [Azohydromonas aeria]|uniref:ATP-binding protein n=1 Tax=Azohydromonas aeria TaxID=2590212 RepID=UPI0012FCD98C|nr:ATP-binding protein [Azohydromonas aeria]
MSPQEARALDPHTLLFSLGVLGLVMTTVFLHFARAMPAYRAALVAWSRAMAAAGAAFLLFFLRGQAPLLLTFVVANAVVLGLACWGHVAHARLLGQAPRLRWTLGASALGLAGVLACFGLGLPRQVAFVAMSVAFAVVLGATALLLLRGTRDHRSPSALASLFSHAALSVAFALRVVVGLAVDESHLMPGAVSVAQLFTLVPGLVLIVVCSLCFLGMVHERYLARAEARHRELERAAREIEQASAMKSRFLASMSHEIRTPLNAILGNAQLLERRATDAEQHRFLGAIRTAGATLLALVNDALDLARIESGRLRLEHRPFRLQDVLARVVEVLGPLAEARGLRLALAPLPEGLPPLAGDARRLEQILYNLVGNAIRFTDRGGVSVEAATLRQTRERVELRLAVRDSGIGIAAQDLDRIFEPFTQADASAGRRGGGTGLGLAICRQLAGLMGGEIGVNSQPGVGSEFWLRLAFDVAQAPVESSGAGPAAAVRHAARLQGLRVLVADDVPANVEVVRQLLESEGAVCLAAGDGEEALQRLRGAGGGIDAVLMDVQMPGLDGLGATRRLRADAALADLPVIALTAGALPLQQEQALAAGMDDFVGKPVELEALVDVLLRWTAPRPARRRRAGAAGHRA